MSVVHAMREYSDTIRRLTMVVDMLFCRVAQHVSPDEIARIAEEMKSVLKDEG